MFSIFSGENVLKIESSKLFWKSLLNVFLKCIAEPDRNRATAIYTSAKRLLTGEENKGDSPQNFARSQALLDACLKMITATINIEAAGEEEVFISVAGGRNILTDRASANKTRQDNFEVRKIQSLRFFVLVSGADFMLLTVTHASYTHVRFTLAEKKNLRGCSVYNKWKFLFHSYL